MSNDECSHLDMIRVDPDSPPRASGCERCLAMGDRWVHLRMCLGCGEIGCCDSSRNKHARRHAAACGHPIVRSIEPGEGWGWCYADEVYLVLDGADVTGRQPNA